MRPGFPPGYRAPVDAKRLRKVALPPAPSHPDSAKLVAKVRRFRERIVSEEADDGGELPGRRLVSVVLPTTERVGRHAQSNRNLSNGGFHVEPLGSQVIAEGPQFLWVLRWFRLPPCQFGVTERQRNGVTAGSTGVATDGAGARRGKSVGTCRGCPGRFSTASIWRSTSHRSSWRRSGARPPRKAPRSYGSASSPRARASASDSARGVRRATRGWGPPSWTATPLWTVTRGACCSTPARGWVSPLGDSTACVASPGPWPTSRAAMPSAPATSRRPCSTGKGGRREGNGNETRRPACCYSAAPDPRSSALQRLPTTARIAEAMTRCPSALGCTAS